ncbi:keratin-associated protein 5-9-like isoform X3 [Macrobrachium rosenbergii]|uniref:keratin-associated protein 5-9-like isoform X3 n=1 Tax=Macrobrachium rosenbergii TaxID=79674 RepID=UPI0034D4C94A
MSSNMIIRRMILLWYLLVHIALTNAQEAEVDSILYCDFMSADVTSDSAKRLSADQVAESLGIAEEDLASVPSAIGRCCSSSLLCYFKGGICLPSWLEIFFSCSEPNLCYSKGCTCFKPKDSCIRCAGSCGNGGTCRTSCVYPEVPAPYNCGIVAGCTCCVRCPSTCGNGGTCRTTCNSDETDTGSCNDLKACRCCKKNCSGISCGTGGYCSTSCDKYPLKVKRDATSVNLYRCPTGCQCCEYGMPYPWDPIEQEVS